MLTRRDPVREITELNETFNRLFDQVWENPQRVTSTFPLDLTETSEGYLLKASLPGLNPDDLDITYSNNMLTIKGEIRMDQDEDSSRYHLRERWFGSFQRSLVLPDKIVVDDIRADYDAGVLTLFLPKSEEVKPRRIQIQPGAQPRMIEGHTRKKA